MNELICVNYDADRPTVLGRDLHAALGVETRYNDWFTRMCEYGFTEGSDYYSILSNGDGFGKAATRTDHQLTLAMAKELCMLQRTEKGKQFRAYFISVEEAWNKPESVMARALQLANHTLDALKQRNAELAVENTRMLPKAEYFDQLVDRNLLTNLRDTAKQFRVKERAFVAFLLDRKYLYRDKRGKLLPYAEYTDTGLFEIKECFNDKTDWSGTQTLITPKGREVFQRLLPA